MDWLPIKQAPKPSEWLRTDGNFLIARIWQPQLDDGQPDGAPQIAWAHVAYLTANGWMVNSRGFAGLHGNASFPLSEATHFMRLPQP